MPIPLMLLAAAASAAPKLIEGIKQRRKAKKLKVSNYLPPSLKAASEEARREATASRYAGQDVDEANLRQNVTDTFHNVAKSSSSPNALLNAASQLSGAQTRGNQQIGQNLHRFKQNAKDIYRNLELQKAEQQKENYNQFLGAKSALKGAAKQNIYGGITDLASGALASFGPGGDAIGGAIKGVGKAGAGAAKVAGASRSVGNPFSYKIPVSLPYALRKKQGRPDPFSRAGNQFLYDIQTTNPLARY